MAAAYRLVLGRRLLNAVVRRLAPLGLAGRHTYVLTVPGRRTGTPRSVPVTLVEDESGRWLVAPYGEREWVKNARAAGRVELSRAGRSESLRVEEAGPAEAAAVLRSYLRRIRITQPFFDVTPDSPLADFEAEAPRHPVFRLTA